MAEAQEREQAVDATTALLGTAEALPIGSRFVHELRRLMGGAALFSPVVALVAVMISFSQLHQARQTARQKPISDVLEQSAQVTMWMADYPEVAAFFEADVFGRERVPSEREVLERLARTDPSTRRRVQVVCEVMADFFQSAYDQREFFESEEWSAWWTYIGDVYRESAVLKAYFSRRDHWYDVDEALDQQIALTEGTTRRR